MVSQIIIIVQQILSNSKNFLSCSLLFQPAILLNFETFKQLLTYLYMHIVLKDSRTFLRELSNPLWNTFNTMKLLMMDKSRTPQDMDGTLTLIFAKLETSWNITAKISAFLQLRKKWILTKFEGCGSKNGPATPIWSFRHFWREIQIQCTKSL